MVVGDNESRDIEVINAINMYVMCKEFRVLPQVGGLLDQDCYHVWLLDIVRICYNEREAREYAKHKPRK